MPEVIWLPEALLDLQRHFRFLQKKSPEAAKQAALTLLKAGDSLAYFPKRFPVVEGRPELRKQVISFGKYGYILYYRVEKDRVTILYIHHGSEDRPI